MIDSISLRLHDLEKHGAIAEILTRGAQGNKHYSEADNYQFGTKVDFETAHHELMSGMLNLVPYDLLVNELQWHDSAKRMAIVKGTIPPPSCHYDIGYLVNFDKDCIDFSLSIPKYLYGQNVSQFMNNPTNLNKEWKGYKSSWEENLDGMYEKLMRFIRQFFDETFMITNRDKQNFKKWRVHERSGMKYLMDRGKDVDFRDLEIIRLDVCFNQYFRDKLDAKEFLEHSAEMFAKRRTKKRSLAEAKITPFKNGGYIVVSAMNYFKVYHKGNEFEKHDRKQLEKHNRKLMSLRENYVKEYEKNSPFGISQLDRRTQIEQASKLYDVQTLQAEADRILRHELRFIPRNMSYYHKKYVYRYGDPNWEADKLLYMKLDAKRVKAESDIDRGIEPDELTHNERKVYNKLGKHMKQRCRFFLDVPFETLRDARGKDETESHHIKEQKFSKRLFNFMMKEVFWKYVTDAQVKEMPEQDLLTQAMLRHNEQMDFFLQDALFGVSDPGEIKRLKTKYRIRKINQTKLVRIQDTLEKYGTLDEAERQNKITSSTKSRWKKDMRVLGISQKVLRRTIPTTTDFTEYFTSIRMNKKVYKAFFENSLHKHLLDY